MTNLSTDLTRFTIVSFVFMYCANIYTCLALNATGTFFRTHSTVIQEGIKFSSLVATSTVECARLCSESNACLSFVFHPENNQCLAYEEGLADVAAYTLDGDCPLESGYKLYSYVDTLLCIKIDNTKVKHDVAENDCQKDGAHLILITDEEMHVFVKEAILKYATGICVEKAGVHVENHQAATSICQLSNVITPDYTTHSAAVPWIAQHRLGSVWVSGRDIYNNDTMYSWKMERNPYIKWVRDDPDNGNDDCLGMSMGSNFDFRDVVCENHPIGYLCHKVLD